MIELTLRQLLNSMSLEALYAFALDTAAEIDAGGRGRVLLEKIFDAIKVRPVPVLAPIAPPAPVSSPPRVSRSLLLRMTFFAFAAASAVSAALMMR